MKPPYTLSSEIVNLCTEIGRLVGQYEGLKLPKPEPQLRRKNQIKTIQSSLSIEGNALSLEQVAAILENKQVIGPAKDILEAKNAVEVYNHVASYNPLSEKSFLKAHQQMMNGLILDAGKWRSKSVGVIQGKEVIHMGPQPSLVPQLMRDLFQYVQSSKKENFLVTSAVFHYEIEFIHPFSDGNGRMGRFWQHVFLVKRYPFFEFIPVESVIKNYQKEYYESLRISDKSGDSRFFIEFCLRSILESMNNFLLELKPEPLTPKTRLDLAKGHFQDRFFSRKDYRSFFKTMSTATASRDLNYGVEQKLLIRTGDKALARYQFS
ncbi:MAG: Fic family protein [Deltaproteobacteria bacterium]|nr:Fic family protein [Deltaproteobacteria bacterium]